MKSAFRHLWVIAPFRADAGAPDAEALRFEIDAHRNLRGPYTAAGELVRRLVWREPPPPPDLIAAHQLTLLYVSPELKSRFPPSDEVAGWLAREREGYPRTWTLRLAHGVTDFLLDYVEPIAAPRLSISFEHADRADRLDQEFLSVLLRRADPERLTVTVCSSSDRIKEPLLASLKSYASAKHPEPPAFGSHTAIPSVWRARLQHSMKGWAGQWEAIEEASKHLDSTAGPSSSSTLEEFLDEALNGMSLPQLRVVAKSFVDSDCTSDSPWAKCAYARLPEEERKTLHLARSATLAGLSQDSLSLGAIPFHQEQADADATRLLFAANRCMELGYYEASLDWAIRGRRMRAACDRSAVYGEFTRNILFASLLLGRFEDVEAICAENLAESEDPLLLSRITYAKAILLARYYEPSRRDYRAAGIWAEKALAFTEKLPPSTTRVVHTAFLRNTMALADLRTGHRAAALHRLSEALNYMAKELPEGFETERALLLHNRARVHAEIGRTSDAIGDLTSLLAIQPRDAAAHVYRGVLYHRSAQYEEALRDYSAAIQWSPPYPEAYFNRALVLASMGRPDEALADCTRVLTLAPDHVDALLHRALLLYDQGKFDASRADVDAALRLNPPHPRLLSLLGLLETKDGHLDLAYDAFTKSIEADPALADAWANRATVLFKRGDLEGSCLDLTQALTLRPDADAFYNRGRVFEAQKKWAEAVQDYLRALQLARGDAQHIMRHIGVCRQAGGLAKGC